MAAREFHDADFAEFRLKYLHAYADDPKAAAELVRLDDLMSRGLSPEAALYEADEPYRTHVDWKEREVQSHYAHIEVDVERQPVRDAQEARDELREADPDHFAEQASWLLDGTCGAGAMEATRLELKKLPARSRIPALFIRNAQVNRLCPARYAAAVWQKMAPELRAVFEEALRRECAEFLGPKSETVPSKRRTRK